MPGLSFQSNLIICSITASSGCAVTEIHEDGYDVPQDS